MTDYQSICETLDLTGTTLVAVSKTKPIPMLQDMYAKGQRIFGENRVQELIEKEAILPKDIQWHFIGHLQSKKVKAIVPFVSLIHSVDSFKLLKEIDKQACKVNRVIDCLLQFHIGEEHTKYGLSLDEAQLFLRSEEFGGLKNVNVIGVMGMATFTDDKAQVQEEFKSLKSIFDSLKSDILKSEGFREISMGMSGDYGIAIKEGSTMVRIGSLLFGAR